MTFCSLLGLSPCDILLFDDYINETNPQFVENLCNLYNNQIGKEYLISFQEEIRYLKNLFRTVYTTSSSEELNKEENNLKRAKRDLRKCMDCIVRDLSIEKDNTFILEEIEGILVYDNEPSTIKEDKLSTISRYSLKPHFKEILQNERDIASRLELAERYITSIIDNKGNAQDLGEASDIINTIWSNLDKLDNLLSITINKDNSQYFLSQSIVYWCNPSNVAKFISEFSYLVNEIDTTRLNSYIYDIDSLLRLTENNVSKTTNIKNNKKYKLSDLVEILDSQELEYSTPDLESFYVSVNKITDDSSIIDTIFTAYIIALKSENLVTTDIVDSLENCGLYFINDVKSQFTLDSLKNIVIIKDEPIVLKDNATFSYTHLLTSLRAFIENKCITAGTPIKGGLIYEVENI